MEFLYVVFVILVCLALNLLVIGLLRKYWGPKKENFSQQYFSSLSPVDVEEELEGPIISKRINMFKGGLCGFFADQKEVRAMPYFEKWINDLVYVWPNAQDVCCTTLEEKPCNCEEYYINNSSCLDKRPYFFNSNFRNNLQSTLGSSSDGNCTMTVLNNSYKLMRRSSQLDIKDVMSVNSSEGKYYRLTISGMDARNISLMRPLYVSFNTVGLYEVIHEDMDSPTRSTDFEQKKGANMFAYYDSDGNDDDKYVIYLRPVETTHMYPAKAANFTQHFNKVLDGKSMSCNIYYFNPATPLQVQDKVSRVLNFYVNRAVYEDLFSKRSSVTFNLGSEESYRHARSIRISKSVDGNIQVEIDDKTYSFPVDFAFYDMEKFDLFICYAFNTLLLVGFGSHKKKVRTVMVRHHVHKQMYSEYDNLKDTFTAEAPEAYSELKNFCALDCIPNYASLFDQLGYVH